jgi:hypothetical protein
MLHKTAFVTAAPALSSVEPHSIPDPSPPRGAAPSATSPLADDPPPRISPSKGSRNFVVSPRQPRGAATAIEPGTCAGGHAGLWRGPPAPRRPGPVHWLSATRADRLRYLPAPTPADPTPSPRRCRVVLTRSQLCRRYPPKLSTLQDRCDSRQKATAWTRRMALARRQRPVQQQGTPTRPPPDRASRARRDSWRCLQAGPRAGGTRPRRTTPRPATPAAPLPPQPTRSMPYQYCPGAPLGSILRRPLARCC